MSQPADQTPLGDQAPGDALITLEEVQQDKLISTFETLNVPQGSGPDSLPSGQLIMNKDDHQGRTR